MAAVSPVAQLIRDVMAEYEAREGTRLSQSDIVRRSGNRLTNSRLGQLLHEPVKRLPVPETIEALALGLRVDPERVLRAYMLAVGPTVAGRRQLPARLQRAVDAVNELPALDEDQKAALVRALLEDWERMHGAGGGRRHAESQGP